MCKPALLAPPLAEGLDELLVLVGEDRPHEEPHAVADLHVIGELDDVRVAELLEHVGLVLEPGVVLRVAGHLEHVFLALPLHEQDDRAGPLADAADDLVAARDQLAGLGLRRVVHVVVVGGGQLVLHVVQLTQEIDDRAGARSGTSGCGAVLDQVLKFLARTVQDGADLEALGLAELVAQFQAVGRRRHAGEDVVGDRAQREDVEVLAQVVVGKGLGGHVGRAGVFHQPVDVRGGRHDAGRACGA